MANINKWVRADKTIRYEINWTENSIVKRKNFENESEALEFLFNIISFIPNTKSFSLDARKEIEKLHAKGITPRRIAIHLKVSTFRVKEEIKNYSVDGVYNAEKAIQIYADKMWKAAEPRIKNHGSIAQIPHIERKRYNIYAYINHIKKNLKLIEEYYTKEKQS